MGRSSREIKAVINLPNTEKGRCKFEKTICDFYAEQVGKRLLSYNFSKEQRMDVLQRLIENYAGKA